MIVAQDKRGIAPAYSGVSHDGTSMRFVATSVFYLWISLGRFCGRFAFGATFETKSMSFLISQSCQNRAQKHGEKISRGNFGALHQQELDTAAFDLHFVDTSVSLDIKQNENALPVFRIHCGGLSIKGGRATVTKSSQYSLSAPSNSDHYKISLHPCQVLISRASFATRTK